MHQKSKQGINYFSINDSIRHFTTWNVKYTIQLHFLYVLRKEVYSVNSFCILDIYKMRIHLNIFSLLTKTYHIYLNGNFHYEHNYFTFINFKSKNQIDHFYKETILNSKGWKKTILITYAKTIQKCFLLISNIVYRLYYFLIEKNEPSFVAKSSFAYKIE